MLATIFCIVCAWTIVISCIWSVFLTLKKGRNYLTMLHEIPCHNCEYFTNDHRLKCTVHPTKACSEQALNCIDFEQKTALCNACQKGRRKLY
jgi:hypothetical protein